MNRISKLFAMSSLTILLLSAGCGDDGNGPSGPGPYDAMTFDLYDWGHLEAGYFYRLWVANTTLSAPPTVNWTSIAEFNVNPVAGNSTPDVITSTGGQVISANTKANLSVDFEENDTLMITIEASGASPDQPSATVVAAAQIPPDFTQRTIGILEFPAETDSGTASFFQLGTPTDADTSNERSGVWFALNLDAPRLALALQYAPEGWRYESWAFHDNTWLSMGKFNSAGQNDDFNGYSAGPGIGFPGEDFIANAPAGVTFPWEFEIGDSIMVTLEPEPENDDSPFVVRLLGYEMSELRPAHVATQISKVNLTPSGTVTFKRSEDL